MFSDQIKSTFNPHGEQKLPESARAAQEAQVERALAEINRADPGYVMPTTRSGLMDRIARILNP